MIDFIILMITDVGFFLEHIEKKKKTITYLIMIAVLVFFGVLLYKD